MATYDDSEVYALINRAIIWNTDNKSTPLINWWGENKKPESTQPAEQGEAEAKIKAEGIKQALNFVRNIFPVAAHQDQLKHAIEELEMFYANYLTDNTNHYQVQEIIP